MSKIINLKKVNFLIPTIKKTKKKIVLIGGCFDILHIGHIKFLQEAKKMGDILIVLLESDEKVRLLKGKNRPIFHQEERAQVLSELVSVNCIVNLPFINTDKEYEDIAFICKPDIVAVTENDPLLAKKRSQAEKTGGKIEIIPFVKTFSSSKLAELLGIC